jgi:hypothetical protein
MARSKVSAAGCSKKKRPVVGSPFASGKSRLVAPPGGLMVPPVESKPLVRPSKEQRRALALPVLVAASRILRRSGGTVRDAIDAAAGNQTLVREYARQAVRFVVQNGYLDTAYSVRDWDTDPDTLPEERRTVLKKALRLCGYGRGHGGGWKVTPTPPRTRRAA